MVVLLAVLFQKRYIPPIRISRADVTPIEPSSPPKNWANQSGSFGVPASAEAFMIAIGVAVVIVSGLAVVHCVKAPRPDKGADGAHWLVIAMGKHI